MRAQIVDKWTCRVRYVSASRKPGGGHSMKRIDIYYGGDHYSVGGRRLEDLQEEIAAGIASGMHWLEVNDGEGDRRQAFILLSPGVPLAIVPVPEPLDTGVDRWRPDEAFEPFEP